MDYPLFLGGKATHTAQTFEVKNKYSGEVIGRVARASTKTIEEAVSLAEASRPAMAKLSAADRREILFRCVSEIKARSEELAMMMTAEVGKTIKDSRNEVARLIDTFTLAGCEAGARSGEMIAMDRVARGKDFQGMWKRVPIGVCSFIVPFNFPLNLSAHKIAPAIAVGCPFVVKPASLAPISVLLLGSILEKAGLPAGAFSILPCARNEADLFSSDPRFKLLSFTGSPAVGWELKRRAGKMKVVLELGGNAACVVAKDADLALAAGRIVVGAFAQSGQSCISVQRVLAEGEIYDAMKEKILQGVRALKVGDPKDATTDIGPLIDEKEALRLEKWIGEAVGRGAKIVLGGERRGAILTPTILEKVPSDLPLSCEEAFGPVLLLDRVGSFDEGLRRVNDSKFGLQAGVFTSNLENASRAFDELEVGGVLVNEVPTFRVDQMPYGGVKDSGQGREGVTFAMEDMTEIRLLAIKR